MINRFQNVAASKVFIKGTVKENLLLVGQRQEIEEGAHSVQGRHFVLRGDVSHTCARMRDNSQVGYSQTGQGLTIGSTGFAGVRFGSTQFFLAHVLVCDCLDHVGTLAEKYSCLRILRE